MPYDVIAPIIQAVASLLWPMVVVIAIALFKKEIVQAFNRVTKAEILGQKIELREELRDELVELKQVAIATAAETKALPPEEKGLNDEAEAESADIFINSIIEKAALDPKIALLSLSAELERQARLNLATRGLLRNRKSVTLFEALGELNKYGFPPNLAGSLKLFMDVRNKIVHGHVATNDDALSALDSGITIFRALNALPNETNAVYAADVDLFSDENATHLVPDAKGILLESISPGQVIKQYRIFPTTKQGYQTGKKVAWEWNLSSKTWPTTWYRDPDTGEIKKAWDGSMEFVGRHLDEI